MPRLTYCIPSCPPTMCVAPARPGSSPSAPSNSNSRHQLVARGAAVETEKAEKRVSGKRSNPAIGRKRSVNIREGRGRGDDARPPGASMIQPY